MKANTSPRASTTDPVMQRELREHATQINLISEGRIAGSYTAQASVPTAGPYIQGDFVRNSTPSELGTAGSKYVIFGWSCVVSGDPATFVQCRFLTGN